MGSVECDASVVKLEKQEKNRQAFLHEVHEPKTNVIVRETSENIELTSVDNLEACVNFRPVKSKRCVKFRLFKPKQK